MNEEITSESAASVAINPRLSEVITGNVGSKLTGELAAGIIAALQSLLNDIAVQAYAAGQAEEREQAAGKAPAVATADAA